LRASSVNRTAAHTLAILKIIACLSITRITDYLIRVGIAVYAIGYSRIARQTLRIRGVPIITAIAGGAG
jgi:hypothetical protein